MVSVGDRIAVDGCRATICFLGQIAGKQGKWIGLEWDDSSKGKHDGTFEGQRYFACSRPGACASFLQEDSFACRSSRGCSLGEALKDKYQRPQQVGQELRSQSSATVSTVREKELAVQLLEHPKVQGRQADLTQLDRASLTRADVATVVRQADQANPWLPGGQLP